MQQASEHPPNSAAATLLARDAEHIARPWSGGEPVPIVKGKDCVVTDADGKEYIDFTAGYFVNQAGHCHPRIIEAATRQLHQITQVSGKQTTPAAVQLAEKLVELTPPSINKVFFATGGSEATEFGLKMARQHTKQEEIAYLENAYHGLTLGALEVCASEKYRRSGGVALSDRTYQIPTPYCYRCKYASDCATQCLDEAEARMDAHPNTGAIIAEPIQSVGGVIPPDAWWERLDAMRKKRGMLLIVDEIQTGIGRTGKMFAVEHYGLEPDIMLAGKGLSGGVGSLSVAMGSDAVIQGFFGGTTPTNGGNAVSAAAGLALIEVVIGDMLIDNAAAMGEYFTAAARDLNDPWIGDVRFRGLLGGIELVADRDSKAILPKEQVEAVHDHLHEQGMLHTVSGMYGNVLRLQPPLSVTAEHIDAFISALRSSLDAVRRRAHSR